MSGVEAEDAEDPRAGDRREDVGEPSRRDPTARGERIDPAFRFGAPHPPRSMLRFAPAILLDALADDTANRRIVKNAAIVLPGSS